MGITETMLGKLSVYEMYYTTQVHEAELIRSVSTSRIKSGGRRRQRVSVSSGGIVPPAVLPLELLWLLLLMLFCHIGVGESAIVFAPTNVVELSLYQTADIQFQSNILIGDPPILLGDWFYFVRDVEGATCSVEGDTAAGNRFTISRVVNQGYIGFATISGRSTIFTVGTSYVICYITGGAAYLVLRSSGGNSRSLSVWSSIYNSFEMDPGSASGGMDQVILSVVETAQDNRPINQGLKGSSIFLIPCASGSADCGGLDSLPELCVSTPAGRRVQLSALQGVGTVTVKGIFSVPYVPSPDGYAVCVPYCSDASLMCGTGLGMSYTVVTATVSPESGFIIHFQGANPSTYTVTPSSPQAREEGYIVLSGTGLTSNDGVRVIRDKTPCTSDQGSIVSNLHLEALVVEGDTVARVGFVAPGLITSPMRGRICYRRAGSTFWSAVYKNPTSPSLDFVIDVLQPNSFTLAPPRPFVGQVFSVFFIGSGLNAAVDTAFLASEDYSTANPTAKFPCTMTGGASPECKVLVDLNSNLEQTLVAYYRKEGRTNDARVRGTIVAQRRNPIVTINNNPPYVGQMVSMEFLGEGLSLDDTVHIISNESTCGGSDPVTTFTITKGVEVEAGKRYRYDAVGAGVQCLQICYRITGSTTWSIVHSQNTQPTVDGCASQYLYVRAYNLRFTLPHNAVNAGETVELTLTSDRLPSMLKLVRATDECAVSFCGTGDTRTTACELEENPADYVSALDSGGANIYADAPSTSYIICAMNGGTTYIPVLPAGGDAASTAFAFTSVPANPSMTSHAPQEWRVGYASLSTTFGGTGLDSKEDRVYAVLEGALLSSTARVCPLPNAIQESGLVSRILPSEETESVVATHSRSDRMSTGLVVHLCYVWGARRRVTHTGSITFLARLPSEMVTPPLPTGGFRAGMAFTLGFTSNTTALQPASDTVHFFRFSTSSGGNNNNNCYCGDNCPESALVKYDDVSLAAGASADAVVWMNPRGFDNYNYGALYVVCYEALNAGSVTYMGRLTINAAQPSYYMVLTSGGGIRVGYPFTLEASQSCAGSTCQPLSSNNSMRVIPVTMECHQLNDADNNATTDEMVEAIGEATSTATRYTQVYVANLAGDYRVCYRLENTYGELAFSKEHLLVPLTVDDAQPESFTSVPALPSAGQFLTIELQCSDVFCRTCTLLRLVPGAKASCWVNVDNAFSSDSCITITTIEFYNQYLPQGEFTVCYGPSIEDSHRVPGTLTVAASNPVHFTASPSDIYVNQDSDVTLTLVGTGLSATDKIFLLTSIGFSCHDLHTTDLQSNSTLWQWFSPSTNPRPLQVNSEGTQATWVASGHGNRFGAGILSEPLLCDTPGVSCTMQLCYARGDEAWAPVPIQAAPNVRLLPSNPSRVTFEKYISAVGMYNMVTVVGRGLTVSDVLTVNVNTCSGDDVTINIGTPTVNADATEWIGVVRFIRGNVVAYVLCYRRGSSVTEIGSTNTGGESSLVVLSQLFYTYNVANFSLTHNISQYELLNVGAWFSETAREELKYAHLIDGNTECNYMPYYTAVDMQPEFNVQLNLNKISTTFFAGRLAIPPGTYALCMEINAGVFRVTTRIDGGTLTIGTANPSSYVATPTQPFPNQPFNVTFTLDGGALGTQDLLQIIDGNLYDCGSRNVTIVGEYSVTQSASNGSSTTATGLTVPNDYLGVMLTMCYKRTGGSFATVPRGTLIERNLGIMQQIPAAWTAVPTQPQELRRLTITFTGDDSHPGFLQTTDRASLVLMPEGDGNNQPSCDSATPELTSDALVIDGQNAVWTIPAANVVKGTYILCYISTSNGAPMRVANPPLLNISETQSPYGVFKNTGGPVEVFSGERFYLMFDTSEPLVPVLSFASDSDTKDAVLFSETPDCASPLTADAVASIPAEFQYKDVIVENPSGITAPHLHLVMRTSPGDYVVCMRRAGRQEGQAFYTYEAIGDVANPAKVTVTVTPIAAYTTVPASPRAWIPSIEVRLTYGEGYTVDKFSQLFFIPVTTTTTSTSSTTASINGGGGKSKESGKKRINGVNIIDDCYRPTADEATSSNTTLLNTSLQVVLSEGRTLQPFPNIRQFQLCLQLNEGSEYAASVHASLLAVLNPSPTDYIVPDVIGVNAVFEMAFRSIDPIFAPSVQGSRAQLFNALPGVVAGENMPECAGGEAPPGGAGNVATFDTFTATNSTYATVRPRILAKAYLYVCFYLLDQGLFFPVRNTAGGFIFSVGLTGAQSYVVAPSTAYMGQQLRITILGNVLSNADHVKIVAISSTSADSNHDGSCTAEAANADAEESNGATGSVVDAPQPTQAQYFPRVNATGNYVLCYQSARLSNAWAWVSDLHHFMVDSPHPTGYLLEPSPSYTTGISRLRITDTANLLGVNDKVKLVARGTGNANFDCSDSVEASSSIRVLTRIDNETSNALALYQVCAAEATTLTLCYLLENGAWMEVPLRIPPPTYMYDPLVFVASPFTGPSLSPSAPRPYELFTLTFESSDATVEVRFLRFAPDPQAICTLSPPYVSPTYYDRGSQTLHTFTVALPKAGRYQLYLGTGDVDGDPRIAHGQVITVGPCDPCTFTPLYTFIGNNVSLTFPSGSSDTHSLGENDSIRVVPANNGTTGNLCDAPTGPFMSLTLSPNAEMSSAERTVVTLPVGTTNNFVGEYYICYRKAAGASGYAIVADNQGEPITLSIYPPLPNNLVVCPESPFYLGSLIFTFSFDGANYPRVAFSEEDEFLLLPPGVDCGAEGASTASGVVRPALHNLEGRDLAIWHSTLPNGHVETKYQICFRLSGDTVPRLVPPSTLDVAAQNPSSVTTQPLFLTPEETFKILIHGVGLTENDDVYIVDASQRCDERCGETLQPTELTTAVYTKTFKNATLVELDFTQALGTPVQLVVCYRRVQSFLVRLAVYFVGDVNPTSYNTSFVPRVGTRPLLTFLGSSLTTSDRVIIVENEMYCDESLAASVGSAVNTSADGTSSSFYLPLVGVRAGQYSVCYLASGTPGYARMMNALEVLPGGPTSYVTSNTPMRGRATVISFNDNSYATLAGDVAIVACAGCSCFDGVAATLPYGTPEVTVTENGSSLTLRVGMDDIAEYPVCYRVFDSGFAQVGIEPIRPVANTPVSHEITPSNPLQGQRLTITLTGFEANSNENGAGDHTPSEEDMIMLVTAARLCWDTDTMNADGVLANPTRVTAVTDTQSTWQGHVPSLGPNALPASSFPVRFAVCFRENLQEEYVAVPFPISEVTIGAADPSSFVTAPEAVSSGMIGIRMTFQGSADGDTAFIVSFAGEDLRTNRACDDATSTVVSPVGAANPVYIFSLPPQLAASSLVVCYTRAGTTVAEVPTLLTLQTPNPSGYSTDVAAAAGNPRRRQYITFTFTGSNLDPTSDSVVFSDVACASSESLLPTSAVFVRRSSKLVSTADTQAGTSVSLVAQFVADNSDDSTDVVLAHVCYRLGTVWIAVGAVLSLDPPIPTTLTLDPPVSVARVGQHVQIHLEGNNEQTITNVGIISAADDNEKSWCHNFSSADVQEPLLNMVSNVLLDISTWKTPGSARVCVHNDGLLWSDVAPTTTGAASDVIVLGPNPLSMSSFPAPPRVGQRVTLTFRLDSAPSTSDNVRVTLPNAAEACDLAPPIPGFPSEINVAEVNASERTSSVTLTDSTDPFLYRSFSTSGSFKICYYNAEESAWSVVGGSPESGTLVVGPIAPTSWRVVDDAQLVFAEPFALEFLDEPGNLNATGDRVWAAPLTQSCGVDPSECTTCILFEIDQSVSTASNVRTRPALSLVVGGFNLCYKLHKATAVLLPNALEIQSGEIECLVENNVRVGQEQTLTFRTHSGVTVTEDSWRVSSIGTSLTNCESGYIPEFVSGRARMLDGSDDTNVLYGLEWPVSMVDSRYLVCYTHGGVARPVCTCGQIDAQSGECYVSTLSASPLSFSVNPSPTYVGQSFRVSFTLNEDMAQYPVTSVKFVTYVDELTACRDNEAFPVADGTITTPSPTMFLFTMKHNYELGAANLIVCALSPGLSPNYARVGMVNPARASNTLMLRPYLTLSTFPTDANLIRAMQTILLTFNHASELADDVVGPGDRITFVDNALNCVESVIDTVPEQSVLQLFMLGDTSFSTIPAPLIDLNNETRTSSVTVTFDATNGLGKRYMCYKLNTGTWAPVMPGIEVLASSVSGCEMQAPTSSPDNGGDASLRAMQYVRAIILGAGDEGTGHASGDAVKVVPQSSMCVDKEAGVFVSGVAIENETSTLVVVFAPTAGEFKVCYRLGGVDSTIANWSPVCARLTLTNPSPLGTFTGCLRLGQTLSITTTHRNDFLFTGNDRFRIVPGKHQCIYVNNTQTVAETITVGDAPQTIDGTAVTVTGSTFTIPPALLGTGSTAMRLCYKDAVGNQFAVPLDDASPAISEFKIASSLPASVQIQGTVVAGQRVQMNFSAAAAAAAAAAAGAGAGAGAGGGGKLREKEGGLVAYAELPPDPYQPGPVYDGTFDVATAISLGSSFPYREGRCYNADPTAYGVYGNSMETRGSFDPVVGSSYVTCYRPMGCSIADVGEPFRVGDYNPNKWSVNPATPRRGQLLVLTFDRNTDDAESIALSPENDMATLQTDLQSCWTLPANAGSVVAGTTEKTRIENVLLAAQPPTSSSPSAVRVCYKLVGFSWSELPNGVSTIQPANPVRFAVVDAPARVQQTNLIEFHGASLGADDRVKIIERGKSCIDSLAPPDEMVSYGPDGSTISGTAEGWYVSDATGTRTFLTVSTSVVGNYSVCYRLANDTVWTLVYGVLDIHQRQPEFVVQQPSLAAEGELFTLEFSVTTESSSGMSANDYVTLYAGVVSCLAENANTNSDRVFPSRTDLLPLKLFFQLASGMRGEHTLCYTRGKVIVWGFPTVVIRPNPWSYITLPAPELLRANQLINAVFEGFGLIAIEDGENSKKDMVKLISSTNPQTDAACQTVESVADVWYSSLEANGTYAVQVVRLFPEVVGSYWVCYKLDGGQYHPMPGNALEVGAADPSGATSDKNGSVWDGEMSIWTIQNSSSLAEGSIAFYSRAKCNDFPYYVVPNPSLGGFPDGVTTVRDRLAMLRAGPPTENGITLSLCYYYAGVITMLVESAMIVTKGIPSALSQPVAAVAMQIFQLNLDVIPTNIDYVVLLANPNECVGEMAPSSPANLFADVVTNGTNIVVSTALEGEGTYYICYSHRVEHCAAEGRECARTIGTVVASAPNPSGWSMPSAEVYTTDLLRVTLSRPPSRRMEGEEEEKVEGEKLWLAPVEANVSTIREVALACMSPTDSEGSIVLQKEVVEGDDVWTAQLRLARSYAVCYTLREADMPTIFPPFSQAVLVVHPTQVTEVTFTTLPVVYANNIVVLHGHGLSEEDALIAVGVPSGASLPNDICSNTSYTPRVTATVVSDGGHGLTSMAWNLMFETAAKYVLCFLSAAAAAASSSSPMVLVTPNPFDVVPYLLSVSVVSVAFVNTSIQLEFHGRGLRVTDQAALIYLTEEGNGDADNICDNGTYTNMVTANEDGTTSLYTTVPTQVGAHVVCYRRPSSTAIQMPNHVQVTVRNAIGGIFTTMPICSEMMLCLPQPVVALVDAAGNVVSDALATVEMQLLLLNGTYVNKYLAGGSIYTHEDYSTFHFLSVMVSTVGEYIMEAKFSLRGGVEFVARTPTLGVSEAGNQQILSTVACQPVGIISRSVLPSGESNPEANIRCTIDTNSPLSPKEYVVNLNAGTSTEVVPNGEEEGGHPRYTFSVNPPHSNPKIQFVSITVTPSPPMENWPVRNSPVIVRIGSRPGLDSTLGCVSNSRDLPSPTMVRVNSNVTCSAQGKRVIEGVKENIVALPEFMRIFLRVNADNDAEKQIDIGSYPENLDGKYEFDVAVEASSFLMEITGSIPSSDESNTYVPMIGSPVQFSVIGEPQQGETSITCVSDRTASTSWFAAVEPFTCTLTLRAGGRLVNGVAQDFQVTMNAGGSTLPIENSTWGSSLVFHGAAPPMATSGGGGEASNQAFDVSVTYLPLEHLVASGTGVLVYLTSITQKPGGGSGQVLLELTGSGLSLEHRYGVRSSLECAAGVATEAVVTSVDNKPNHVQLRLAAQSMPYFLCFAPSDSRDKWQLLFNDVLNHTGNINGSNLDTWTVLLIVGILFLLILLGLLILLVWRVCLQKRRKAVADVQDTVYFPPRVNDRFVRRPDMTVVNQSPFVGRPLVKAGGNHVRLNINDRDVYAADVRTHTKKGNKPRAPHTSYQKLERAERGAEMVDDDLNSGSTLSDRPSFIPPPPPPRPPSDDNPPIIGAVGEEQVARVRNGNSSPRSGPYQHLHYNQAGYHPLQAGPSSSPHLHPDAAPEELPNHNGQLWAGPFVVNGYSSRPLATCAPSLPSSTTQSK